MKSASIFAFAMLLFGLSAVSQIDIANAASPMVSEVEASRGVAKIYKTYAAQAIIINDKMNHSGIERIISPEYLTTETGLKLSRRIITDYENLIKQRRQLLNTYYSDIDAYIANVNTTQAFKSSFLKASNETKSKGMVMFDESENAQLNFVRENKLLLALCEKNFGSIKFIDGQFTFPTDELLNSFQLILDDYGKYGEQVVRISEQVTKASDERRLVVLKLMNDKSLSAEERKEFKKMDELNRNVKAIIKKSDDEALAEIAKREAH